MASIFNTETLKRTPDHIDNLAIDQTQKSISAEDASILAVANKLMDHLRLIREYEERIKAIDYLIENADRLAGNHKYITKDPIMIAAVNDLGGTNDTIDFALFKKAVDIMHICFEQMALVSITGVKNGY
jgi:hypothetical protein